MNRPKSATEFPELSMKSSGLAHREQIQLGSGATMYVATTINGRKLCQMADERMTRRKPTARTCRFFVSLSPFTRYQWTPSIALTNDRPIIVLIPAAIVKSSSAAVNGVDVL